MFSILGIDWVPTGCRLGASLHTYMPLKNSSLVRDSGKRPADSDIDVSAFLVIQESYNLLFYIKFWC